MQHHWNPRAARVSPRSGQPQACSGVLCFRGRRPKAVAPDHHRISRTGPRRRFPVSLRCWRCPGLCAVVRVWARLKAARPPLRVRRGPLARAGGDLRLRCWTDPGAGDGRCRCEGAVDQDRPGRPVGRGAGIEREARNWRRRWPGWSGPLLHAAGRWEPPAAGGFGAGWRHWRDPACTRSCA